MKSNQGEKRRFLPLKVKIREKIARIDVVCFGRVCASVSREVKMSSF